MESSDAAPTAEVQAIFDRHGVRPHRTRTVAEAMQDPQLVHARSSPEIHGSPGNGSSALNPFSASPPPAPPRHCTSPTSAKNDF